MINFLNGREIGIDSPDCLTRAECTRRAFSLDISKHYDVQKIHTAGITTLDIDQSENRYLLSGAADGIICIHDLHNSSGLPCTTHPSVCSVGRSNRHRHKHSVETVQWYPLDTGMFLSSGMDKLLKVWDTNTLKPADEFEFSSVVYSHHMSSIATRHCLVAVSTQSSQIKLVDLKSGSATHSLKGHRKAVFCIKWSPKNENLLASGSADSKVILWDVRMAKGNLRILDQHNGDSTASPASVNTAHDGNVNGLCFTPDGLHILTFGTDEHLRLWDTSTGRNTNVNYGRIVNDSRKTIKFSVTNYCKPDLVFVPANSNIEVFDIFSGIRINTLRGHYNQVNCCLYREDYQELYSGANDRNLLIWLPYLGHVQAYEDELQEIEQRKQTAKSERTSHFTSRIAATADTWSSDED